MSTQVPTQSQSQVAQVTFSNCLIVTRHKLLETQQQDVAKICEKTNIIPELPSDQNQLKQILQPYDAVIGVLPITIQLQILQLKKAFVTFAMESLGTVDNKEDAEKKASQYPGRCAILSPSKEGEKYRVTLYQGLKLIKEIKVIDEWLIQHPS